MSTVSDAKTVSHIDFRQKIDAKRPYQGKELSETTSVYELARPFESDRGRIVNSAAVRRLQQKTQVFPLERNAAVRSRLTHSLEVQQVGRYITKEILHLLDSDNAIEKYGLKNLEGPFESIVEMACLMHDIGNPPFGHFGEAAINDWFEKQIGLNLEDEHACTIAALRIKQNDDGLNELRKKVRRDLCSFEGNAQGLRLIHTLQGLNLTYSQLASLLKYTRPAYEQKPLSHKALQTRFIDEKIAATEKELDLADYHYLMKKPGYYLAEEDFVKELNSHLNMAPFCRYPLTYIMEAADDISYCIADLEDAVEKGILTVNQLVELLKDAWRELNSNQNGEDAVNYSMFKNTVAYALERAENEKKYRSIEDVFFMRLRVSTISKLVPHAAKRFIDNLETIFDGRFNGALLETNNKEPETQESKLLEIFKKVALKFVFSHPDVENLELKGYRVITGLLDIYGSLLTMPLNDFTELNEKDQHKNYLIETRLWHKLSSKHRLAYDAALRKLKSKHLSDDEWAIWAFYYRGRLIQDYISGMTDLYAYEEYRRLMAAE